MLRLAHVMWRHPMVSTLDQQGVPHALSLRFFDLDVRIRSDDRTHLDRFARMYRRFVTDDAEPVPGRDAGDVPSSVEYAIWTRPDNPWGGPVVVIDKEVHPLPARFRGLGVAALTPYVYQDIVCDILSRVRSHILIHAGVVARDGQGVLLVADSFHGKTTLVLALVRCGHRFLSDETAALGRADGCVHPFPRSLSLRPGTLERAGYPGVPISSMLEPGAPGSWGDKQVLDIEQIRPGCLGRAVPVGHVLLLSDPDEDARRPPERELAVLLDRADEDLFEAVRQIDGVSRLRVETARGCPLLRLRVSRRTAVYAQIEALCRARGVWILDVLTDPARAPAFSAPARLEELSRSQAILELLRRYQGGYRSAVLDELGGRSTRLFMELATLLGPARCHRLYVGPLDEMVELVCAL
jgi:hypothetical protein